jgi:hypothetical protein
MVIKMINREYLVTFMHEGKKVTWETRNVDAIANKLNAVQGVTEFNIKIVELGN